MCHVAAIVCLCLLKLCIQVVNDSEEGLLTLGNVPTSILEAFQK